MILYLESEQNLMNLHEKKSINLFIQLNIMRHFGIFHYKYNVCCNSVENVQFKKKKSGCVKQITSMHFLYCFYNRNSAALDSAALFLSLGNIWASDSFMLRLTIWLYPELLTTSMKIFMKELNLYFCKLRKVEK